MKTIILTIISILLLSSCGGPHHKPKDEPKDDQAQTPSPIPPAPTQASLRDLARQKYELYRDLAEQQQDEAGFIRPDDCETLMWSSMLAAVGFEVDLELAKDSDGLWHRNPHKDCVASGEAPSHWSKDMGIGQLWYMWERRDRAMAEEFFAYAKDHKGKVGENDAGDGRHIITGNFARTLADIIYELGGEDHHIVRKVPLIWGSGLAGSDAHLQVLHILIRGRVNREISDTERDRLKEHLARQPSNGLYQYAVHRYTDGVQDEAVKLMADDRLFPKDGLPRSIDRCDHYVWRRDEGSSGLKPCDNGETHAGLDLIFLGYLVFK